MRFITSLIVAGLSLWPVGIGLAQPITQFNVKNFGAAGDGVRPDTEAINKAIVAARDAGGGTVLVPAGNYVSGTIQLQNNVTLWLDAGATILGTKNLADYHWPEGGREWDGSMVLANGVHNVALMGRGTISGQNLMNPRGEERIRGPHAVLFNNSKDIVVRDITIKDAGNYSLILRSCERVNIDNFTAYNGYDGINMHDVRQATISNSKLYTGDDSLAGAYWENVTVTNCILNSSCNAIRVGGRNVLINNCLIYGPGQYAHRLGFRTNTESGFQILPHSAGRGNAPPGRLVTPGPIDNMVLSNITMINVRSPVYIAFGADAPYSGNNLGVGRIVIENLTAINCGRTPFYVAGPREKPAKSIILRNARMTFVGGVSDEESNGQGFSPYSMIQAYGVYGRNVESLELHDVRVDYLNKDRRPAIYGENIGTLELDRFAAQREPDGAPSLLFDGIGKLLMNGAQADYAKVITKALNPIFAAMASGEPSFVSATVQNTGHAGLADVQLQLGNDMIKRTAWLGANETARIGFANLKSKEIGEVPLRLGDLSKSLKVQPKQAGRPVSAPYLAFQNLQGQVQQVDGGFYIREAGDFAVLDHGDQYGAAYLPQGLGVNDSAVVKLENPDGRTNWVGRAGIMVRKDISKPGQSAGYLVLGASPANGFALEWDSNSDGSIDKRTELDGYTDWPCWLKLERHASKFIGYSSKDGANWSKIGEADVPGADGALDIGVFAHRDSARFMDFKVTKTP
jgi:Pectate lyase superfamily protein